MKKPNKKQEQEVKKLSKKYFWEQKATEVSMFVLIVLGVIAAIYISSSIFLMVEPHGLCDSTACYTGVLLTGLVGLFGLLVIILIPGLILLGIYEMISFWIKNNQDKARRRAQEELGVEINDYESW